MPTLIERATGILKRKAREAETKQLTEKQRAFSTLIVLLQKDGDATDDDVAKLADIAQRQRLDESRLQAITEVLAQVEATEGPAWPRSL